MGPASSGAMSFSDQAVEPVPLLPVLTKADRVMVLMTG